MNVYDSARMADVLAPLGYATTDQAESADLVILNTCHIREKAAEKVFSELGRLRDARLDRGPAGADMLIAVAGCVAQAEGAELMRRAPYVDMVFGPQTYHRLPQMIAETERSRARQTGGRGVLDTDFPVETKFDTLPDAAAPQGPSAFLTVQEGCDKFCAFCVVPYTRGSEYSRPAESIIAEAKRLIASGAREITLLGQNVNAWHGTGPDGTDWSLGRLLRALADQTGIARLRYTTSHPREMDDDLILAHRDIPALMPFLHLPVQSGSDRILAAMNRQHSAADYLRTIERLRSARPDIGLSSDFITGFPGETDADFAATLDLVRAVGFAQAYSFKYSQRPGTPATLMPNAVPEAVKAERLAALMELLNEQQLSFNHASIGRDFAVLLDRRGRRPGQFVGRSPFMQSVHVDAPESSFGEIVQVRITGGFANGVAGRLVDVSVAA